MLNITHYQRNANQNYSEAGRFFPTVPSKKPLGNHLGSPWEIPRAARDMGSIPGSGRTPRVGNGRPTPVFLQGKFHGQVRLVGLPFMRLQKSHMTEHILTVKLTLLLLFSCIQLSVTAWIHKYR